MNIQRGNGGILIAISKYTIFIAPTPFGIGTYRYPDAFVLYCGFVGASIVWED
jgi:hypothetical protein